MENPVLPRIIADHLGSIRVTLDQSGNIDSWTDYYPFGKESRGSSTSNRPKEQFTGKERDSEIGLDYFGARYYNAEIGRWVSKDPLAEKYPDLSPYSYSANNPIFFIDPNGKELFVFGKDKEGAFKDLRNFVGEENAGRLSVSEDGRVTINTEGYEGGSDALDLLIEIDQAKTSDGENLKIGYAISADPISPSDIDAKGNVIGSGIKNASETHRYAGTELENIPNLAGEKPKNGFNGEVTVSTQVEFRKDGKSYERGKVTGHELKENLHRTRDKNSYEKAHKRANEKFFGGDTKSKVYAVPKKKEEEKK